MWLLEIVSDGVQEFVVGFANATARREELRSQYPGVVVTMQYNS